ncbi:hypothetical protein [Shewanella litoralis]|nr:hypothetical protein [Shewanella litoralis]
MDWVLNIGLVLPLMLLLLMPVISFALFATLVGCVSQRADMARH